MKKTSFPYVKLLVLCCSLYLIHCKIIPELVVERTTHIVFPGDQIDRFFQCLCESSSLTCTIWYSRNETEIYNVIDTNQTEATNIVISSRNFKTFTCSISEKELFTHSKSNCVRSQGPDDCVLSPNSFCRACDVGFAVIFWEFENNAIKHNWNGLLNNAIPTTTSQTTASVASADDEDNLSFFIIIGVLSAVVLILLILVIVLIVLLRHRPKPEKSDKKPEADFSPLIDADTTTFSTNSAPQNGECNTNAQGVTNELYAASGDKNSKEYVPLKGSYTKFDIKEPELSGGRTAEPGESRGNNEENVHGSIYETHVAPVLNGESSSGYTNTTIPRIIIDGAVENKVENKANYTYLAPEEKDERSEQYLYVNEDCAHAQEPETISGGSSGMEQKMPSNGAIINGGSDFAKKFSTASHQTDFIENSAPAQKVDISNIKGGGQNGGFLAADIPENSKQSDEADYSTATYL